MTTTRNALRATLLCAASFAMLLATAADARPSRTRISGQNGAVTAAGGPNGGFVRGRGAVQNADGGVTAGSGGAFATAGGARGARASTSTINPDGSATRQGGFGASGARGSASGESSLSRSADGTRTGTTSTTATSAATGNTYKGATTINSANGKPVRTATCTDASGNSIACPR